MTKGGCSHSLKQGGTPRRRTKDGELQLDALGSQKGKLLKLLMMPRLRGHHPSCTLRRGVHQATNLSLATSKAQQASASLPSSGAILPTRSLASPQIDDGTTTFFPLPRTIPLATPASLRPSEVSLARNKDEQRQGNSKEISSKQAMFHPPSSTQRD
jgi:hypothetical protein